MMNQNMKLEIPIPTLGRIVHAVIRNGNDKVVTRPAIIVGVFHSSTTTGLIYEYKINVQVWTDGANDNMPATVHKTSLPHSRLNTQENSWHWPARD